MRCQVSIISHEARLAAAGRRRIHQRHQPRVPHGLDDRCGQRARRLRWPRLGGDDVGHGHDEVGPVFPQNGHGQDHGAPVPGPPSARSDRRTVAASGRSVDNMQSAVGGSLRSTASVTRRPTDHARIPRPLPVPPALRLVQRGPGRRAAGRAGEHPPPVRPPARAVAGRRRAPPRRCGVPAPRCPPRRRRPGRGRLPGLPVPRVVATGPTAPTSPSPTPTGPTARPASAGYPLAERNGHLLAWYHPDPDRRAAVGRPPEAGRRGPAGASGRSHRQHGLAGDRRELGGHGPLRVGARHRPDGLRGRDDDGRAVPSGPQRADLHLVEG